MADEPVVQTTDPPTPTEAPTETALGSALKATPTETPPAPPAGAPEAYGEWKLPEGYELDKAAADEASPIFKELNLTQDQAQKLVDFYAKHSLKSHQDAMDFWSQTRKEWRDGLKADEVLGKLVGTNGNFGPDSPLVVTINRALDGLQNPKLVSDFKDAMELTGAGDNPAFVKVLHALASKVTEGSSYVRGEPVAPAKRPSPGAALFPNLPSSQG